jgi:ring-1,2-phenylacetyl-CoA epoxidase subunit PaaE
MPAKATETTTAPGAVAGRRRAAFHTLRVSAVDRLTDDAVAITFDVPPQLRGEYAFTHGQHVTIRWPAGDDSGRRNYSICSSAVTGSLRIAVRRLPGGAFSSYATERLRPGDTLEVMTPTGHFFTDLDPGHATHYVAIAAGSGITPILSIIRTVLETEPGSSVTLVYGNRTTGSIMFLEELADLKNRYLARFTFLNVLSREPQEAELLSGRIDRARLEAFLSALLPVGEVGEWFLCGPFAMVTELRQALLDHGADPAHVHLELFHAEGAPVPPPPAAVEAPGPGNASTVTMMLDGRTSVFQLAAAGEPILDAALRVRPDAPYACKGGVCGTCRARLVAGEVRMDSNYALEQSELEADVVLACQSHPVTESVTLDFDI